MSTAADTFLLPVSPNKWWVICLQCYAVVERVEHEANRGDGKHDCKPENRGLTLFGLPFRFLRERTSGRGRVSSFLLGTESMSPGLHGIPVYSRG